MTVSRFVFALLLPVSFFVTTLPAQTPAPGQGNTPLESLGAPRSISSL